jgi:hypothetical protein
MRCMVCDGEMMRMKDARHDTRSARDFERRCFRCLACDGVERHLVSVGGGRQADAEPLPVHEGRYRFQRGSHSFKQPVEPLRGVDSPPPSAVPTSTAREGRGIRLARLRRWIGVMHRRKCSGNAADIAADKHGEVTPARICAECRSPMVLVCTLPATARFPMQRFYKCSSCHSVADDALDDR